jgi:GntR family transcriptional regulator, transcriptional repressor for pyruvate dehydrogenase complex
VRVTEAAIEKIRELIASGQLTPGERLPSEKEFAAELGISRGSLREAVRVLSQGNVLDVRQGDGTYVSSLEPAVLLSGMGFLMDLMQGGTLLEIFEVRRLLEPAAAALAAQRITSEQIDSLRRSLDALRASSDVAEQVAIDLQFHADLAASTGNTILCSILQAMHTRAFRARLWRLYSEGGELTWALRQHELIIRGLEERDPELARAAAMAHLSDSQKWLQEFMHDEVTPRPPAPSPAAPGSMTPRSGRMNWVVSPTSASSRSGSYASGDSSRNARP